MQESERFIFEKSTLYSIAYKGLRLPGGTPAPPPCATRRPPNTSCPTGRKGPHTDRARRPVTPRLSEEKGVHSMSRCLHSIPVRAANLPRAPRPERTGRRPPDDHPRTD
ncbi:hypothetical protein SCA03_22970 [Streptomyces cacaoi]|uniref:Uncharacterized protein n=1 Tax=Streptomyces cacaoi TaxID=1898 RepID=A0A4Y3QWF6_STRCI|nr:hypothetical protein SCA03_22970 [Streptomyces cacaoi]